MPSRPRCQVSGSTAKQAGGGKLAISRLERVLGEGREDVGEEQLLVLLLVVDPELDQSQRFGRERRQRALQRFVDVRAIGADLVERRAAQHAAPGPGVPRALALVIAVEQIGPALVERRDSRRRDREARTFRRTRSCGRGAIWPATRRGRAGSPRRHRKAARRGRASACGWRTAFRQAPLGAEFESSRAIARLPATNGRAGIVKSSLYVPQVRSAARRARLPEHVAALGLGDAPRTDEQMVRQAVEIREQVRVERFAPH